MKNPSKINPKSMKIHPFGSWNQPKIDPGRPSGPQSQKRPKKDQKVQTGHLFFGDDFGTFSDDFPMSFSSVFLKVFFSDFGEFLGGQKWLKSVKIGSQPLSDF